MQEREKPPPCTNTQPSLTQRLSHTKEDEREMRNEEEEEGARWRAGAKKSLPCTLHTAHTALARTQTPLLHTADVRLASQAAKKIVAGGRFLTHAR